MLSACEDLLGEFEALGITSQVPNLIQAARFSSDIAENSRLHLREALGPDDNPFDVIAVGSIARLEASPQSDFDYLIVVHELPERARDAKKLLAAVEAMRKERLNLEPPGPTGMFGKVIAGSDLTERIGLQEDTNLSHSRRVLVLEESVSLYQPDRHSKLIELMLSRYLAEYDEAPKAGVPRFLLNDLIRYWRTIAVDYQAKWWEDKDGWALRYLKLIISRKLAYAGSVVPLLLCQDATVETLAGDFARPALARLARLRLVLEDELVDSLRGVFLIAEEFAAALGRKEFRTEVKAVGQRSETSSNAAFSAMREKGRLLQSHLQRIFFDSRALREVSCKYLSF